MRHTAGKMLLAITSSRQSSQTAAQPGAEQSGGRGGGSPEGRGTVRHAGPGPAAAAAAALAGISHFCSIDGALLHTS